jgi:uncharacterized membrane protein
MFEPTSQVQPSRARFSLHRLPWKGGLFLAVGLLIFGWLFSTPPGFWGKTDAIGYAVCHRIESRSFHIGDRALPLCARCSGMYLGAMLGLVFHLLLGKKKTGMPTLSIMVSLGFLVLAFGVDGVNSYLHFFPGFTGIYEPQNWLRLVTGMGMGLVIISFLYPAFSQTVWEDLSEERVLKNWAVFGVFLLLAGGMVGLVLTESPVILYPLAIISSAGVLVLLTMVYSMVLIMLFRIENHYKRFRELAFPLLGGFFFTLLQIAFLDMVRFLLTRTWGGFPFL